MLAADLKTVWGSETDHMWPADKGSVGKRRDESEMTQGSPQE